MKSQLVVALLLLALSVSAKHKHMALKSNLAAYWNFEQNPVLFPIHDQSGNGNHLFKTADGNVLITGRVGQAVQIPGIVGSNGLQPASNTGISHQGNPFTVAFWYKPTTLEAPGEVVGGVGEWFVIRDTDGSNVYLSFQIDPFGANTILNVTSVPLELGEWYFCAFGWDGTYAWATVNLSPRVRTAHAAYVTSVHVPFFWGNNIFDEMGVWRRTLTDRELREIFNDGDGLSFEDWDVVPDCKLVTCCD